MTEILFVCTGNTCRSPMAEGITNALAARTGLTVIARSAGIAAFEGCAATEEAETAAAEHGADISGHRSRRLTAEMCRSADRIVVIEDGRIAETGTHAQLMANDGTYRALYRTQNLEAYHG